MIEAISNFTGADGIFYAEQFNNVLCNIHTACGVDSWRNPECDFGRGQWPSTELGHFQQRLKAGIDRRAESIKTEFGKYPILSDQRDGIGDCGNCHHFHERGKKASKIASCFPTLQQSLREFESNRRSTQHFAWVFTTGLIRIYHS